MVKLLTPLQIERARNGQAVRSYDRFGQKHESIAQLSDVHTFICCRCCGAPIDKHSTVLRVDLANYTMVTRKPVSVALHVDNCLAPGFIQTRGYGGRVPLNRIRFVDDEEYIVEAKLENESACGVRVIAHIREPRRIMHVRDVVALQKARRSGRTISDGPQEFADGDA